MECPNCGHNNNDAASCCENCGGRPGSRAVRGAVCPDEAPANRRPVPDEIKGFNFGAFSLSIFWTAAHRLWLFFAVLLATCLIPFTVIIGFAVSLYLGFKGNELAWKARTFDSVKQFKETQRFWSICGMLIIVLSIVVIVAIGLFYHPENGSYVGTGNQQSQNGNINNLQDLVEKGYLSEGSWPLRGDAVENDKKGVFEYGLPAKRATLTETVPYVPRQVSGHRSGIGTHSPLSRHK